MRALKKFCQQKGIGFINNNNLGQRGNSVFAKNLLKYTNKEDWINFLFNFDIENEIFDKGIEYVSDVSTLGTLLRIFGMIISTS